MKMLTLILASLFSLNAFSEIRLIQVIGTAEKASKPDIISFDLAVWAKGNKAREAQTLLAEESTRVKKLIEKFKVKESDYMTISYELNPNYVYDQKTGQNVPAGYMANEIIHVKLVTVAEAGNFIDEVATSKEKSVGVNINSINWDISNRTEVQKELMNEAIANAQATAEQLAKAAKVKIRNVHTIVPGGISIDRPMPMYNMKALGAMMDAAQAPQTNLSSGQVKVISSVNVDFEIE